ncbi:hypothetical protein L1267_20465 [Pseudoalteromonas sp. OFAV1]|uniref:hypothetical protein n=1 Tax=Pseudoalteromonas sp. OFAV1 TaxID=2908892 RepID=UPI001F2008E3|nr:hypothetical protein [Pseudoalteromonas sp. OFAV1]MCF2902747.1 hypothetical protein [Pseudoalteromonas sp. OFAV1]
MQFLQKHLKIRNKLVSALNGPDESMISSLIKRQLQYKKPYSMLISACLQSADYQDSFNKILNNLKSEKLNHHLAELYKEIFLYVSYSAYIEDNKLFLLYVFTLDLDFKELSPESYAAFLFHSGTKPLNILPKIKCPILKRHTLDVMQGKYTFNGQSF